MWHIHDLLRAVVLICLVPYKANGASLSLISGTFTISDNEVEGKGTYTISNGTVDMTINVKIIPSEFTQEEKIGLAMHNNYRQVHQVPAMTLDRQMCDQAKAYAQKLAQMGTLKHASNEEREGQGENLAMGCSTNKAQTMEEAVTNWYNQVCDPGYDFNNGSFSGGTGHFTQVVWKESTVLGIGRSESEKEQPDGTTMKCAYIVGRYKPAGNMQGQFEENVPKGHFNTTYCSKM